MTMVYLLGEKLIQGEEEKVLEEKCPALFIVSPKACPSLLKRMGIDFRGSLEFDEVYYCKLETHKDYLFSTLTIPDKQDISQERDRLFLFVNQHYLVFAGDTDYAEKLIRKILLDDKIQGETKARFLYNFMAEMIRQDAVYLEDCEKKLMELEDSVGEAGLKELHEKLRPLKRRLQILRSYYEQMSDVCDEMEENRNNFFDMDYVKYFRILSGRFDRLRGRCADLLEYAREVKDAYQAECDGRQNNNMALLTVISTVFLPLTLITGWYGMNFKNMPELERGYPAVIILSLIVIIICIFVFKKKKMF